MTRCTPNTSGSMICWVAVAIRCSRRSSGSGSKRSPDPTRGSAETRARPPAATTLHHRQQEGRSMATETARDDAIAKVVESATRLGVELDEAEAADSVAAMETEAS